MGLTVVNMEDIFQILNVISILKFTLLTFQLVTQRSQADALKPTVHHCWTKKLLTIKNVKLWSISAFILKESTLQTGGVPF